MPSACARQRGSDHSARQREVFRLGRQRLMTTGRLGLRPTWPPRTSFSATTCWSSTPPTAWTRGLAASSAMKRPGSRRSSPEKFADGRSRRAVQQLSRPEPEGRAVRLATSRPTSCPAAACAPLGWTPGARRQEMWLLRRARPVRPVRITADPAQRPDRRRARPPHSSTSPAELVHEASV